MPIQKEISVATYNVHRCIGTDGVLDVGRISEVIRILDADVVGLQEVGAGTHFGLGMDQFAELSGELGYGLIEGATLNDERGRYGNALLTRLPIDDSYLVDLTVPPYESRSAIVVGVSHDNQKVQIVATHFGLRRREREAQADILTASLKTRPSVPTIYLGDFNSVAARPNWLDRLPTVATPYNFPRTYPSRLPILRLDRILTCRAFDVRAVTAFHSQLTRKASDHLPLRAELNLCGEP